MSEDRKKNPCGDCIETMLTFNTRVFARYGYLVSDPKCSVLMFVLGAALCIGLACGITVVEYENNLDNLWVEKGSRAANERDVYDEYFGGPGRLNLFGFTFEKDKGNKNIKPKNETDYGVLTKEVMYAFSNTTRDLMFETGKFGVQREMTLKSGARANVTFSWKDFCSRPTLPTALGKWAPAPFPPAHPLAPLASVVGWLGAGTVGSGGLQFLTSCLSAKAKQTLLTKTLVPSQPNTLTPAELFQLQMWFDETATRITQIMMMSTQNKTEEANKRPGLPIGWGASRAPCTRAAIHDLFAEGSFDYPDDLALLNSYAYALATLSDQYTIGPTGAPMALLGAVIAQSNAQYNLTETTWFSQCYTTLGDAIQNTTVIPGIPSNAKALALPAINQFLTFAVGSGYWWRPSIEDSATPKALAQDIFQSLRNGANFEVATCVAAGLYRKMLKITKPDGSYLYPTYLSPTFPLKGGCAVLWSGTKVTRPLFVGGLVPKDLNTTASDNTFAAALRFSNSGSSTSYKFLLDRLKNELSLASITTDEATSIVREIEQQMIDYMLTLRDREPGSGYASGEKYSAYEPYFLMDRSTGDLFDEAAEIEGNLLIGGYLGLICFSTFNFILFSCPPSAAGWVYSRAHLIFLGLCSVGIAIAASFGFCGWVGFKLSPVNSTLIPFLGIGLGTSDIFVFVHELYRNRNHQDNPRERITMTMADAGSSVLVSTTANVAGFLIPGGVVKLPAIYTFSIQMGICIILNWITAMTLFVPCMVLNAYRTSKRGLCVKTEVDESSFRGASLDSFWSYFAEKVLGPLYSHIAFKIFAVCAFIAFTTGLAVHGFQATKNGLLLSDVVVKDHYAYDYLTLQEAYFDIMPGSLFTRPVDFEYEGKRVTFADFQANILDVLDATKATKYMDPLNNAASLYFLPSFIKSYGVNGTVPVDTFYANLSSFLKGSGTLYIADLVCRNQTSKELITCENVDGVTVTLEATSGTTYISGMVEDEDYVEAIKKIRHDADNAKGNRYPMVDGDKIKPIPIFYAGSLFKYWQQYVTIDTTAYRTVGFSLLGVFGVTCFTQASPISSILVGVMLFATVLQLYGFMAILDIKLNGWSVTNLGICVGVSVQTTAYYSSAFLRAHAESNDPNERMRRALVEMFPPLITAAITSLVSVVVLAFAKFPFFRLYFFVMIGLMVALAFLNGVVFLPVIMSIVAPKGLDKQHHAISIAEPTSLANSGKKDGLENSAL